MTPENIDDLFRRQLEGHETPPDAALWARLAAGVPPEGGALPSAENLAEISAGTAAETRVDTLFRAGLNGHASPVRREVWERLEDEHLRPRKRQTAAFWPLALAAVLALLLVAGGAGVWLKGRVSGGAGSGTVARRGAARADAQQTGDLATRGTGGLTTRGTETETTADGATAALAATGPNATAANGTPAKGGTPTANGALATNDAPASAASSAASARRAASAAGAETAFPALAGDAKPTARTAVTASRTAQKTGLAGNKPAFAKISDQKQPRRATRPRPGASGATSGNGEPGLATRPAPAPPTQGAPQPAVALAPAPPRPDAAGPEPASTAASTTAPGLANPASGTIEVDVRPGGATARTGRPTGLPTASASASVATTASASASAETARPGGRAGRILGGLLRQARNLGQGQPLSLADAAGLVPGQTLTLEARLGRRSVSKSIQL